MKNFILSTIIIFSLSSYGAIPNQFSVGEKIEAQKINDNFNELNKRTCPSGFISIEKNNIQMGCIQSNINGSAGGFTASYACFTTYGGRLPTTQEWIISAWHAGAEGLPFTGALKTFLANTTNDTRWTSVRPPNEPLSQEDLNQLKDRLRKLDFLR